MPWPYIDDLACKYFEVLTAPATSTSEIRVGTLNVRLLDGNIDEIFNFAKINGIDASCNRLVSHDTLNSRLIQD